MTKGKKKRKLTRAQKIKKVKGFLNMLGEWARNVQASVLEEETPRRKRKR